MNMRIHPKLMVESLSPRQMETVLALKDALLADRPTFLKTNMRMAARHDTEEFACLQRWAFALLAGAAI